MNPIKCLVRPIEAPLIEDGCLVLLTQPIGCNRAPSVNQVKLAAHSVLVALAGLHAIGWVHRDVHPLNIMSTCKQEWYLMSLEWSQQASQPLVGFEPKPEYTPPETVEEDGLWITAAEFGKVLEH